MGGAKGRGERPEGGRGRRGFRMLMLASMQIVPPESYNSGEVWCFKVYFCNTVVKASFFLMYSVEAVIYVILFGTSYIQGEVDTNYSVSTLVMS